MPVTIHTHDGQRNQRNAGHQGTVNNQFVESGIDTGKSNPQFQERFKDAHNGIVLHVLVGIHGGIVGDGHHREHSADNQTAIHYFGSKDTVVGDIQNAVEEEVTGNKQGDAYHKGNAQVEDKADIEDTFLLFFVPFAFAVGHETLGGTGHGGIEEAKHGDGATYDVEDTKVGSSKSIQNETGGVQRNEHRYTHLGIEEAGVLDDAIGGRGHIFQEKYDKLCKYPR